MKHRYKCTSCGLVVAGKLTDQGHVTIDRRSACSMDDPLPCVCVRCRVPETADFLRVPGQIVAYAGT